MTLPKHIKLKAKGEKRTALEVRCSKCRLPVPMTVNTQTFEAWRNKGNIEQCMPELSEEQQNLLAYGRCATCLQQDKETGAFDAAWGAISEVRQGADPFSAAISMIQSLHQPMDTRFGFCGVGMTNMEWHGFAMTPYESLEALNQHRAESYLRLSLNEDMMRQIIQTIRENNGEKAALESSREAFQMGLKMANMIPTVAKGNKILQRLDITDSFTQQVILMVFSHLCIDDMDVTGWAWTLSYIKAAEQRGVVTLKTLASWFPVGFPSAKAKVNCFNKLQELKGETEFTKWLGNTANWPFVGPKAEKWIFDDE